MKKNQFWLIALLAMVTLNTSPLKAQMNIGDENNPHTFSVLELTSKIKKGGLRLPQLTTTQRNDLALEHLTDPSDNFSKAKGLVIFNTTTNCVEMWNGTQWLSFCSDILITPLSVVITPASMTIEVGKRTLLTATVTPRNATAVQYLWEYSLDGTNWMTVTGETSSTLNALAEIVGITWYRVTASNKVGSVISNVVPITGTMPQGGGTNPNINMYIGAFWRWDETGERIIQFGVGTGLGNSGDWTASVVYYDSKWINPFSPTNPDGVVLTNSNLVSLPLPPANLNAENYQITGSQSIKGTVTDGGTITFRIGLNKQFTSYDANSNPARYAVMMLTYANGAKWKKFFIRQGEGADFVMRSTDSGPGTLASGRPAAVKFMPYNLLDSTGNIPANYNNAPSLATAAGRFTDYPTKAGYSSQYYGTKFFAPDNPLNSVNGWPGNANQLSTYYWDQSWELCPAGFRRPTDGSNPTTTYNSTGDVSGSEIRQSLWQNPPTGTQSDTTNSTWGYYADGYFDRRQPTSALISGTNTASLLSAVAPGTLDVAYIGRLFFNPITNASLFFPATGYREPNNGGIWNAGGRARYWTSTSYPRGSNTTDAWFLYFYSRTDNNSVSMGYDSDLPGGDSAPSENLSKVATAFIRCVKAPPY